MAISLGANISYKGRLPLDDRNSFNTILDMVYFPESSLDEGHISYCKETDKHYKFNSGNETNLQTGKWREFNSGTSTDEKVKLTSLSTNSSYLSDLLDNSTIKIDIDNDILYVAKLKDMTVTVAEINLLQGLSSNVQKQINNLSKSMSMYGVFDTKADLIAATDVTVPSDGGTAIIREDETSDNAQMTYIYIASSSEWTPVSETTINIRDFAINPINLSSEVTGILPEDNIDENITRNSDLTAYLDKDTFLSETNEGSVKVADTLSGLSVTVEQISDGISKSHSHTNSSVLDKITDEGLGNKFLTNDGTYKNILLISDTPPEDTNMFWVDNSDSTKLKLKIYDGTDWKEISSSSSTVGNGVSALEQSITSNVDVGGISSGYTFHAGSTLDEIVSALLVKYYEPEVTFNILPATEYYESGTSTTGIKMSATVVKKSEPISNIDFYINNTKVYSLDTDTDATLPNGGEYSYTYNGTINKDAVFKVVVKDTKTSITKTVNIKFVTPFYYGTSATPMISTFTGFSKFLGDKTDTTFTVTSTNKYIVFAYNSTYGELTSILDSNGFENIDSFTFTTTVIDGVGYNIYATDTKVTCENFKYTLKFD